MSKTGPTNPDGEVPSHSDPPPGYSPNASAGALSSTSDSFQTTFACVSLNMTDRIRFIRFPAAHVQHLEQAIRRTWSKGVQSTRVYGASHEIKMRGNPWSGTSWDYEKMAARALMSSILGELYSLGWLLKASVDISKKDRDKDSLLFRYQSPPPPPCDWLSISFLSRDKIYLLNAPADLRKALVSTLGPRIQRSQDYGGPKTSHEIKLHGTPWFPSGEEAVSTRVVAVILLEVLERFGFSLYASVDQDIGHEGRETDTWHCCRVKGWHVGQPVYHS